MFNKVSPNERLLVISGDSHAGPTMDDMRPYCDPMYLEDFDEHAREMNAMRDLINSAPETFDRSRALEADRPDMFARSIRKTSPSHSPQAKMAFERTQRCQGLRDPAARLADMDIDGIAADVIFAGGQNGEVLPFVGFGVGAGPDRVTPEHRALGCRIWNRWLADFVLSAPERHVGVMQVPMFNVPAAIAELNTAREAGLKAVNFPSPKRSFATYNDRLYEPFWSACEDLDLPLLCHAAGGEQSLGLLADAAYSVYMSEMHWMSRRALPQMIFSGVFERHPRLRLVFVEQGTSWVKETLCDMDSIYLSEHNSDRHLIPRLPSEYWATNCYVGASFPAPRELAMRHDVGVRHIVWGGDYPHSEGTWPHTSEAMRFAFEDIPPDEISLLIAENALTVFDLDKVALEAVAARIGPTMKQITTPLNDLPDQRGMAFRNVGAFA
jgi:predicted TIM-barrel fold metal-dependent hydrolase